MWNHRRFRAHRVATVLVCGVLAIGSRAAAVAPAPVPPAGRSDVRFTITENALLDWLKAATSAESLQP